MINLVQLLCPARHCIIAAAFDPETTTFASVVAMLDTRRAELHLDPWCGLCGSRRLEYEEGKTLFPTLEMAMPILRAAEASNMAARLEAPKRN